MLVSAILAVYIVMSVIISALSVGAIFFSVRNNLLLVGFCFGFLPIIFYLEIIFFLVLFKRLLLIISPITAASFGVYDIQRKEMPFFLRLHSLTSGAITALSPLLFIVFPFNIAPGVVRTHFYKLCGAKIGKNTRIYGTIFEPEAVEIGKNVNVGMDAIISGHVATHNKYQFSPIKIGDNVLIGGKSIIFPGAIIEDNVIISALSCVPKNKKIPKDATFLGLNNRIIRKRK